MVADPDPGKSEGGDSREVRRVGGGGGWAEDMEGRSGLTLLLHTPVLSLTLVYIIFLVCSSCAAGRGLRDNRTRTYSRTHTGHGRHRCDFFIIRKELGKGGRGSGIIRVPGYFLFFSGPETGGDSGDNFLVPDPGPFYVAKNLPTPPYTFYFSL
jgi:hypothetical protein